jgi:peptide/nickel transport system substrate-binding protein
MHRRDLLRASGLALAAPALAVSGARQAWAQSREDTLLVVVEVGQNSLDPQGLGVNQATLGVTWNIYDRLIGFGIKTLPDGNRTFDFDHLVPELAESWQVASDGASVTFRLRPDAVLHDGTKVTAADVKWSLDRAVSNPGPASQMRAGALEKPEQFVIVDERTIRVDFITRSKLSLPDLAVIQPSVFNSALCKAHATADDPWALNWVKTNAAGGGAYTLESWTPRQETILTRNEAWVSGKKPTFQRIVIREIPSAGSRRALLQRGDADLSFDLPPRDYVDLAKNARLKVLGVPATNTFQYVGMNTRKPPFDDVLVRQAVAWALPYQEIFDTALQQRGRKLFGGPSALAGTAWPQPFPYATDPDRAKALLAQAGKADGFDTTLTFDLGTASIDEPVALFIQEALAALKIRVAINKLPPGQLRGSIGRREQPFYLFSFGAWFDSPEYFFFLLYDGKLDGPSNGASYANPEVDAAIDTARATTDPASYDAALRTMMTAAMRDVPYVPIVQPFVNVAMRKDIGGFVNMFHRQLDYRPLTRV